MTEPDFRAIDDVGEWAARALMRDEIPTKAELETALLELQPAAQHVYSSGLFFDPRLDYLDLPTAGTHRLARYELQSTTGPGLRYRWEDESETNTLELTDAGELAKDSGDEQVHEAHVRDAQEQADIDRFSKLLEGQPTQTKAAVFALSILARQREDGEASTRDIYDQYEQVTAELGIDALSQRRMADRLNEQVFLDILGRSDRVGRGRGQGMTRYYHLLEEPTVVQTAIQTDSRFADLSVTDS